MSDMQKSVRFSFGNPSRLDYCVQPYHDKMSLNELRAAGVAMDAVDKYNTSGYFYPIQYVLAHKKREAGASPVNFGRGNVLCKPNATTAPERTWAIMDAIKLHRRFSPRRLFYILCATLPALSLQPVISSGRDPPANQTHYG